MNDAHTASVQHSSVEPGPRIVTRFGERLTDWQYNGLLLVGTRIALTVVGFAGVALLGEGPRRLDLAPGQPWLQLWAQWDSEHYLNIATEGYSYAPGTFSNIPFFPLYPALIGLVLRVIGRNDVPTGAFVGFVIANVALFAALTYLTALIARDFSLSMARRTVLYVLIFPMTLFFSAVYAESLFLATAAACLYHARKGEWYRAGLAGGLAALARPFGFLLVVPIAVEMWHQRPALRALPSIALVPAGIATYFGYLWLRFGDPLLYFKAGEVWGRGFHLPWETLMAYVRGPLVGFDWPYSWLDLISMTAIVVLVIAGWWLLPRSYWAFAAVGVLFSLSTGIAWFSASRHALALFPVIIVLVVLGATSRVFGWAWLIFSIVVAVGFMARFAAGYWLA
jgi:Gpi18-like mannosyltransferase